MFSLMALPLNYDVDDAFVWHNLVAFLLLLQPDLFFNKLSLQNMEIVIIHYSNNYICLG